MCYVGFMAKRNQRYTGNRNPPGYVCPKRQGRTCVTVFLEPQLVAAMKEATSRAGITRQDAIEQLCEDFVREHGVSVQRYARPSGRPARGSSPSSDEPPGAC
jgi:hypothetical protein